jgi:hypothetical protein
MIPSLHRSGVLRLQVLPVDAAVCRNLLDGARLHGIAIVSIRPFAELN